MSLFFHTGYPLDSGNRSGSGFVGQTIIFCRLSIQGRLACPTESKKHRPAIPIDDDRRHKTIVCPTSGGSFS
jgi:hypothetical protein